MFDLGCKGKNCKFAKEKWPRHLPKPTCRLIMEFESLSNPVTIATYKEILYNRIGNCSSLTRKKEIKND
jgi:hypothetical protein